MTCQYCEKQIAVGEDQSELQALNAHLKTSPLCHKAALARMPGKAPKPIKTGIKVRMRKN
jgi:hypothetical protein